MAPKRASRRGRNGRPSFAAYCCVRAAIVVLGSTFSVFLLMMSHMQGLHHESPSFAVAHAASGAAGRGAVRTSETDREAPMAREAPAPRLRGAADGLSADVAAGLRAARESPEGFVIRERRPEPAVPPPPPPPPPVAPRAAAPAAPDAELSLEEIVTTLTKFLGEVHDAFAAARQTSKEAIWNAYVAVAERTLVPFERKFAGRTIRPVREDGSVFVSVAAYRDHMLGHTLSELFGNAASPERVVAGVVMQNCVEKCRTGVEVVSKPGEPTRTKVSDAPPDRDGVLEFCSSDAGRPHCEAGRVRVLRVNETESLGPAFARYLASKLWLGEHYYVQIDAHMWTVDGWDEDLRVALRAAPSYPKVVMSAYPPGPDDRGSWKRSPRGTGKLCGAEFSKSSVEAHIIRLSGGGGGGAIAAPAPQPPRSVYVGAGFFAAHASFLGELPFDPYLPFVFMGEEIALTTRFFTNGWDVYAPRVSLFAHQYRPGKLGLPKFWESTDRTFGSGGSNTKLMLMIVDRVKHVVGYPDPPKNAGVLAHLRDPDGPNYGLGGARPLSRFLDMAGLDMVKQTASTQGWCSKGQPPPPEFL